MYNHHKCFMALFPGPPGWAGARRELLDFMVQGENNRARHTDHPAGRHYSQTNQCPPPPSPHIFYGPDALPAAQLAHSKLSKQVAKVIWHKAVLPQQTDGSIIFARWHHWNTTELCFLQPTQRYNPNGKLIGSAIFAQLTGKCRSACPFP